LKSGDSLSFYVEIEEAYTYESIAATMGGESVRVYSTKIENSDSTSKTTTYSCSILNVTGDVKVTVNLKGRTYKINLAKEPDEYHFQQVDVTLDSAGTVVAMTPGEELGTSTEVAYGKAFYFVVRAEEGYSAENATVVYDDSLEDVGKIKIGDDDFVVYKVYKLTSDQVSEEGTITVKGVVETQLITVETNEKVEIVSLKNYKTEEELKKKVEEGVTKYTALSGQSYILTFKVPTGYTLSVVNNSSSLTPTQNSDGSYYFKLASINSEQDVSISLDEMRFVFNFEGYGTDNLNSVAVNGSEIGANGYDFEGLESGTYYTFAGWTCASLNLNSVNSIPWAQLNKMSATEYTFKSAWTFNKEKAIEALKGMYETKFSVTRTTGEETDQIVAQVKYDKTLMAELEEEMKAHGDSILATGFINYKCVDGDFVDKVNRIPWARLSTEELPTAADSKLLYLFSFSGSADKAQLKMWSYMSGLYMDRWTVTGVEKDDDRTIYAYTVLQVNGEVIYVYSDGQEANGTATAVENND
jgi:hypothetical protein